MSEKWKNFCHDIASHTSVHGLKYVVAEKSKFVCFYWITNILVSLAGGGWLAFLLWSRFMELPTRVVIRASQAPPHTAPFPAVTVCDANYVIRDRAQKFVDGIKIPEGQTKEQVVYYLTSINFKPKQRTNTDNSFVGELQRTMDLNNLKVEDLMRQLSTTCEETLFRCRWESRLVHCGDIFESSWSTEGFCCAFNIGNNRSGVYRPIRTGLSGSYTGLSVVVRPWVRDRALVQINSGYDMAGTGLSHYLNSGWQVFFGVATLKMTSASEIKQLHPESRSCLYRHERRLQFFPWYSAGNCPISCRMLAFQAACGCIPHMYPAERDLHCNVTHLPCIHENYELSRKYLSVNFKKRIAPLARRMNISLDCNCVENCNFYSYRIGSLQQTSLAAAHIDISGFYDGINARDDAIFHIFLEEFSTVSERTTVQDVTTLLSSLGGVFGLFLGCSFVTLLELVFFISTRVLAVGDDETETSRSQYTMQAPFMRKKVAKSENIQENKSIQTTIVAPAIYLNQNIFKLHAPSKNSTLQRYDGEVG